MDVIRAHPNTQVMLDAWRRLADGGEIADGPGVDDHPGLVASLFVLNQCGKRDFAFRRAGATLDRLFGRQLIDHNFLSVWHDTDRQLVDAGLAMALKDRGPLLIHARGETLAARRIDLEFALAPLEIPEGAMPRFLGLCQTITPEETLGGRPLRALQALAIFPPAPPPSPAIRIVSSR